MVAKVLVEISHINVDKLFDYIVPEEFIKRIKIGIRVKVPFNNSLIEGFVLKIDNDNIYDGDLKQIIDLVDEEPILDNELLYLGQYISKKYFSTLISAYQTMLPKALKAQHKTLINKKIEKYVRINKESRLSKLNDTQEKIINLIKNKEEVLLSDVNKISYSSVKTLLKNNILVEYEKELYRLKDNTKILENEIILTEDQEKVKKTILSCKEHRTFLLHGVTGSGKTVVYMQLVEEMLKLGKDSIFLVPEISLTPQMVYKFKSKFGDQVAVLHSALSDGERYDEYRKIKQGMVHIVVGARSAVFAPFKNIGIIIIDEEHTTTYKQDSNPKYSAIDIAIKRAEYHNALVVLGSATPSLESYAKALKGKYDLLELKNRANKKPLPNIEIIDMNGECKKGNIFSSQLIKSLKEVISKKEQAILLLNRRGYAPFINCSNCGNTVKCPNCDITLTYHKSSNTLRCHYCGYGEKKLEICPVCKEKAMKNLGVGTEKVEEILNELLDAKIVRMDLDTTSKKGAHEKIITAFKNKEYDILLGTQMIAKGLDFPDVTLVGIINADTSLMIPNYRSSEYTFDLLMQTSGRSGRSNKEGKVIIQTFNPHHYAISFAKNHDYLGFFKQEMNIRRKLSYPPYYYLMYIKIIGKKYEDLSIESNKIGNKLKNELKDSIVLGPTTCSVFKLNGLYRFGIIIKYKKDEMLYETLNKIILHYKDNTKIKIDVDINPNVF